GLAVNQAAVAAGAEPTAILTKQFFDCFVFMGGCGATICLLIAILLFSRNRARRGLGLPGPAAGHAGADARRAPPGAGAPAALRRPPV
ncbi:MAG: hypothetical protein IKN05_06860, partial [Clostridia bacterium]|nr:hypothetical protein [Clostridia bacterium]